MSNAQDYYTILGVPQNALMEDVHNAYRVATRRFHPDVNKSPGAAVQFREIVAAYEVLANPSKRDAYDRERRNQTQPERPYFTLRVTPSKRVVPTLDEPQVVYVLVELLPERTRSLQQLDSHLNLALVIDHSTSMKEGGRLDRTKIAAYQIIEQLTDKDVLSIISFSDRADVLVPASPVVDKPGLKARVATMAASGGTEIFQGLEAAYKENQKNASKAFVNHIILITDGRTYGDEKQCLELADKAAKDGVGISAMGIGEEWNDTFLDQLASRTGGTSEYINSPNAVIRFLNDRVKSLGQSFAERVTISLAPDPDVRIESAFRLTPSPQPIAIDKDPIPIGQLMISTVASVLLQLQMPASPRPGFRNLVRIAVTGDVLREGKLGYKVIADTSLEVSASPPPEEPPLAILDALSKLTLYRLQEKAEAAVAQGNIQEATRRLENLATRLLAAGQESLANAAMAEARRVAQTNMLSEEGQKALKYGTRLLIGAEKDTGSLKTNIISS